MATSMPASAEAGNAASAWREVAVHFVDRHSKALLAALSALPARKGWTARSLIDALADHFPLPQLAPAFFMNMPQRDSPAQQRWRRRLAEAITAVLTERGLIVFSASDGMLIPPLASASAVHATSVHRDSRAIAPAPAAAPLRSPVPFKLPDVGECVEKQLSDSAATSLISMHRAELLEGIRNIPGINNAPMKDVNHFAVFLAPRFPLRHLWAPYHLDPSVVSSVASRWRALTASAIAKQLARANLISFINNRVRIGTPTSVDPYFAASKGGVMRPAVSVESVAAPVPVIAAAPAATSVRPAAATRTPAPPMELLAHPAMSTSTFLDVTANDNVAPVPPVDTLSQHLYGVSRAGDVDVRGTPAIGQSLRPLVRESGLLGALMHRSEGLWTPIARAPEGDHDSHVFLNTHDPFCLVAVGVQGSGKSHTMGVVLESCLIDTQPHCDIVRLDAPLATLVLHYDTNPVSVCEATGLGRPSAPVAARASDPRALCVPMHRLTILVSPSFYHQRKAFYEGFAEVKPLLFSWSSLTAQQIKQLLRVDEADTQLYVATMLDLLRRYQRGGAMPVYGDFMREVEAICKLPGQSAALSQRKALLETYVAESNVNRDLRAVSGNLSTCVSAGQIVVADLTDPLLSPAEANGIFRVLVQQFRSAHVGGAGKLLALDEAHKYMDASGGGARTVDGLSRDIVDVARLMRHDGMRLVVSTQSPKALADELLELVTVAVVHRFHSADWMRHLRSKIPLSDSAFEEVQHLEPGQALVYAARHRVRVPDEFVDRGVEEGDEAGHTAARVYADVLRVHIRPRLTADHGSSRTNTSKAGAAATAAAPTAASSAPGAATAVLAPVVAAAAAPAASAAPLRIPAAPASAPAAAAAAVASSAAGGDIVAPPQARRLQAAMMPTIPVQAAVVDAIPSPGLFMTGLDEYQETFAAPPLPAAAAALPAAPAAAAVAASVARSPGFQQLQRTLFMA